MITKNELIDTLIDTKLGNQQRKHAQRIIGLKWVLSDKYRERKDIMV